MKYLDQRHQCCLHPVGVADRYAAVICIEKCCALPNPMGRRIPEVASTLVSLGISANVTE